MKKLGLVKVLSDPVRLQILLLLMMKQMTIKQLSTRTGFSPPNIHRHIRILLDSKLITPARTEVKRNIIEKYYRTALTDEELQASLASKLRTPDKASLAASLAGALMAFIDQSVRVMEERPESIESYPIAAQINIFPLERETKARATETLQVAGKEIQELAKKSVGQDGQRKFVVLMMTLPYE